MAGECPRTLSGVHVFSVRGPRQEGGWFTCLCGERRRADDARLSEMARRLDAIRVHREANCPCQGDIDNHDYWCAVHAVTWQERRVRIFDDNLWTAQRELAAAMRAYRDAEHQLRLEIEALAGRRAALSALEAPRAASG